MERGWNLLRRMTRWKKARKQGNKEMGNGEVRRRVKQEKWKIEQY